MSDLKTGKPTKPEVELKPCPCCGNKAWPDQDKGNGVFKIWCLKCGLKIERWLFNRETMAGAERKAVKAWNRRTK